MTKLRLSFLLLTIASASSLQASTISVSDFSGSGVTFVENKVLTSSGAALVNGEALVRVGFFTALSSETLTALKSEDRSTLYQAISTYFVGLGEGLDTDLGADVSGGPRIIQRTVNGSSQTGRLAGQINGVTPGSYAPGNINGVPAGTQLFVLVYDKATLETATELAIFSANDNGWRMPSDNLASITLNTTLVDTPGEIYRGTSGSIRLAPIPEPSASLLALGAAAVGFRRRRR
jgi:hypothetical protein